MAFEVSINIRGLPEMIAGATEAPRLLELEERTALMRSVFIAEASIKSLTPRVTGRLFASWHGRVDFAAARGVIATNVKYGPYVEFGTMPHVITPNTRRALRWRSAGGYRFAKRVRHPGTRAQHPARRGLQAARPLILREFREAVKRVLATIKGAA